MYTTMESKRRVNPLEPLGTIFWAVLVGGLFVLLG